MGGDIFPRLARRLYTLAIQTGYFPLEIDVLLHFQFGSYKENYELAI